MTPQYTIGLDYGTNSVRALIVDAADGREVATAVWNYEHGQAGVILSRDPNLARQHPADYIKGTEASVRRALAEAKKKVRGFKPEQVAGIGVDTTGSTPLPVDQRGQPLAFARRFANNPAAMAWLWKDHTSVAEAAEITDLARNIRPKYLAKCGGTYSSEWFFSKILHCLRTAPEVFDAAAAWMELADYIPAALTGTQTRDKFTAGICAAGHKAMYSQNWGGYPDREFLARLSPKMGALRERLAAKVRDISATAGKLTGDWATRTGLREGIPVAASPRARWSRSSAPAPATSRSGRCGKNWRTSPACAASSAAACCRIVTGWRRDNRRWATFSTGLSIIFNPAGPKPAPTRP